MISAARIVAGVRKKCVSGVTALAVAAASYSVPASYVEFAEYIGVTLSPAQMVAGKVAFDGTEPVALEGEERELARKLFGDLDTIDEDARSVLVAVCGGRGGKTYSLIALRMLHLMLTVDLSPIAPGQKPVALVVAPNEQLRQEAVNYALGAAQVRPEIARLLVLPHGHKPDSSVTWFGVRRPDFDRVVRFESGVATSGGYGGRGRSLVAFAMDECAFFRDGQAVVNDRDIYSAASARVLPGGQTIVASTPWGKSGLLYDLYSVNKDKPITAMAMHAPTTLLNPSEWAAKIVARERHRDPDNARREFDAEFMSATAAEFFDADLVKMCTVPAVDFALQPGDVVRAGADFGFRTNSSALVIAVLRAGVIHVPYVLELKPLPGEPLMPGETVKCFAEVLHAWGCTYLVADEHYRMSITEHLVANGLSFANAPTQPHEAFVATRVAMRGKAVQVHEHPKLQRQLREVKAAHNPGGTLSISQPLWKTGEHGDIVSAMVLAVSQLGGTEQKAPKPPEGTAEWEAAAQAARRKAAAKAQDAKRSWWQQ